MTDPALAIQRALIDRLRGQTDARDSVFDTPPADGIWPRIVLGPSQSRPERADCYDGTETFVDLHIWSRDVGYVQVKTIAGQVRGLLDDWDMPLDGHVCDLALIEDVRFLRGEAPHVSRAIVTLKIQSQPA